MRWIAASGLSLALCACAFSPPEDSYTVAEVLADISSKESSLNGKTISVTGWLGECEGNNCALFQSLEDARKVADYRTLPNDEWMPAFNRSLAVGSSERFDSMAGFMQFNEVIITGEVNAQWKAPPNDSGTEFGCLDRCDDIRPQSIELLL